VPGKIQNGTQQAKKWCPMLFKQFRYSEPGCRKFLGGVGFLFYPTPEVQLNHFLNRTPKLRVLARAC